MEYAIITLNLGNRNIDFELPRYVLVAEIQDKILGLLAQQIPEEFADVKKIRLMCDGQVLSEQKNLDQHQICSGAILEAIITR